MPVPSVVLSSCAALLICGLLSASVLAQEPPAPAAPEKPKVVVLEISAAAEEDPAAHNPLGPTRRNFRGKLEQIRALAADPAVQAVVLEVNGSPGPAKSLDLLAELQALKATGKFIACYAEVLGRDELLFASVADHLCVPPSGMIVLEGLLAESMYFKDLLAWMDARVEVLHVGEYKTAFEELTLDAMSAGQRETIQALLDEFWAQTVATISEQRGIDATRVLAAFERLMLQPVEAQQLGLLDQVGYRDAFDAALAARLGGEPETVRDYGDRTKEDIKKMFDNPFALFALLPTLLSPPDTDAPAEPYVAIVYASGPITSGKSQADWSGNVSSMGSETIVEALEKVGKDEQCKAVVLRVNSPGGSALASDMIWRAIERVKERKPVVSSMGSVAASGGYWISMGCSAIVAQPSTITGSIGVVSMLPDLSATVRKLGVKVETVSAGPLGDELSLMAHGPSEALRNRLTAWMEATYDEFVDKVSAGRKLERATVLELARGRVWTGRQALGNGLVDELGGLEESIELACAMGGLASADAPRFELPEAPNMFEQFEESMEAGTFTDSAVERLLCDLGLEHAVALARHIRRDTRAIHGDRVQALLPFSFVLR